MVLKDNEHTMTMDEVLEQLAAVHATLGQQAATKVVFRPLNSQKRASPSWNNNWMRHDGVAIV